MLWASVIVLQHLYAGGSLRQLEASLQNYLNGMVYVSGSFRPLRCMHLWRGQPTRCGVRTLRVLVGSDVCSCGDGCWLCLHGFASGWLLHCSSSFEGTPCM